MAKKKKTPAASNRAPAPKQKGSDAPAPEALDESVEEAAAEPLNDSATEPEATETSLTEPESAPSEPTDTEPADTEPADTAPAPDEPGDSGSAPADAEVAPEAEDAPEAEALDETAADAELPADDAADDDPEADNAAGDPTPDPTVADEEPLDDLEDEAAVTDLPVPPPAPPAVPSNYTPPPPYDPDALPGTSSARTTPGFVPPVGADYMLADAMGTAPKKKRIRPALLVGAAVLVLALVGGIIWAAPTLMPGLFGPSRYATPKAAVETYLNALAQGDSATALAAAATAPAHSALLTDAVLKSSQQRAPLTNIVVKDATGSSSATVSATYQLGGKPVTANFATKKVGNEWRLTTVTRDVQLNGIDKLKVTLNGLPITEQGHLTLFPGSYALASANDRLTVVGGEFIVQSPSDFANPSMSASISKKGLTEARAAAQSKLDSCLKKKELAPAGCGFGVKATGVKPKTIQWRVTSGGGALKNATFRVGTPDPYLSTVYPYVQLQVSVYDTAGRHYTGADTITTAKADLSGTDVVVTFNS